MQFDTATFMGRFLNMACISGHTVAKGMLHIKISGMMQFSGQHAAEQQGHTQGSVTVSHSEYWGTPKSLGDHAVGACRLTKATPPYQ